MPDIRDIVNEIRLLNVPKGLWYLATPYAKYPFGKDTAAKHAAKIAAEFIKNDVAVFCPIAHGHLINMNGGPVDRHDIWLPLDELFMRACVGVIVARMPGYHYSTGVNWEIKWFAERGISPLYCDVAEFLELPEYFNERALSDEAEAKIMNEPQPMPPRPGAEWDEMIPQPAPAPETDDKERFHCGDPDCESCGALTVDPREAHGYRKDRPVTTGVLDYFPLAMAEVARISKLGNDQHNPGSGYLHWERTKSTDHADCIGRHLSDRGGFGLDGAAHSGNLAWRALALLQTDEEDRLLKLGVRPEKVFSRAHTFHGMTAAEFWTPVPRPADWATNTQAWVDAANDYWESQNQPAEHQDEASNEPPEREPYEKDDPSFQAGYSAAFIDSKFHAGYAAGQRDIGLEGAAKAPAPEPTTDGQLYKMASDREAARAILRQDMEAKAQVYAAEAKQRSEDVLEKAAFSLASMVHEWYVGGIVVPPPPMSTAVIKARLKRFL